MRSRKAFPSSLLPAGKRHPLLMAASRPLERELVRSGEGGNLDYSLETVRGPVTLPGAGHCV